MATTPDLFAGGAVGFIDWLDVIVINLRLGGLDVAITQRQRNQITRKLAISKFANWTLCLQHPRFSKGAIQLRRQ